ncbi:DnaJ domain-containing protein [Lyophyllum atratum]|nr:DnaJ domain-containing protein [Lyophyllum atratum]
MVTGKCIPGPSSLSSLRRPILPSRQPTPNNATIKSKLPRSYRPFSTSCSLCDHYKTLGVSPGASKAQIKSHFYQLSKKHHPDVSKDVNSKEIFTRVTEAYAVLSNDRERRLYDRSLLSHPGPSHPIHPQHPRAQYQPGPRPGYSSRPRPGATHAWENTRTGRRHPSASSSSSYAGEYSWSRQHTQSQQHPGQGRHYEPPRWHEVRPTRMGAERTRASEEHQALERVQRVSGMRRALQVFTLLIVSAGLVGGWR